MVSTESTDDIYIYMIMANMIFSKKPFGFHQHEP